MKKQNKISLFAKVLALSLGVTMGVTACGNSNKSKDANSNDGSLPALSDENSVTSSEQVIVSSDVLSSDNGSSSELVGPNSSSSSSSSSSQSKPKETGTTVTLSLNQPRTFANNFATIYGVGTQGSDYEPAFTLNKVSDAEDALSIVNGKTRFRQGDSLRNVRSLGGVKKITIHGGDGYFDLYLGYNEQSMYKFAEPTSNSGDRIFDNLPNINYFKLVGKYDDYVCDISEIEIEYTRNAQHEMVDGVATPIANVTVVEGTFIKCTNELVAAGNTVTINGTTYTYTGIVYDNSLVYVANNSNCILVKFNDANTSVVVDCAERFSSLSGTYTKVIPATAITMLVNGAEIEENDETSRRTMDVGETFTFSATSNAVPSEDVEINLVDEENPYGVNPFTGDYTFNDTMTVQEVSGTWEQFELTIVKISVSCNDGDYMVSYEDNANGGYDGRNGTAIAYVNESETVLSFTFDVVSVSINREDGKVHWTYDDEDDSGIFAIGEVSYVYDPEVKLTAEFEDGVVTATAGGNFYLECSTSNNVTARYYVYVNPYVPATVTINPDSARVATGETYQINAVVNSDATNKTLSYRSGNADVATVDNTGLVTGVNAGTTTITIETVDGNSATLSVEVYSNSVVVSNYSFDDENGDTHTLALSEGVEATIDGEYHFTFTSQKYVYDGNSSVSFTIRKAGGTNYLDFIDSDGVFFGFDGPIVMYGGDSIEIGWPQ